jgi:hypothetical protein
VVDNSRAWSDRLWRHSLNSLPFLYTPRYIHFLSPLRNPKRTLRQVRSMTETATATTNMANNQSTVSISVPRRFIDLSGELQNTVCVHIGYNSSGAVDIEVDYTYPISSGGSNGSVAALSSYENQFVASTFSSASPTSSMPTQQSKHRIDANLTRQDATRHLHDE